MSADAPMETFSALRGHGFSSRNDDWILPIPEIDGRAPALLVARTREIQHVVDVVVDELRVDLVLGVKSSRKSDWKRLGTSGYFEIDDAGEWRFRFQREADRLRVLLDDLAKIRCPHCSGWMSEKIVSVDGPRKGQRFLGCVDWPDCKGVRAPWRDGRPGDDGKSMPDVPCPECGAAMAIRYARHGPNAGQRFMGCSNYPECKRIVGDDEAAMIRLMKPDPADAPHPIEH